MGILRPKQGPRKDFKEVKNLKREDSKTINALPDFEIRTMKDDLAGVGVKRGDKNLLLKKEAEQKTIADGTAPAVPKPGISDKKETKTEIAESKKFEPILESPKKEEGGMIVPENLPIAPMFKKTALPGTEELIRKQEESPLAPLPPQESEKFFTEEAPPTETPTETEKTPKLPQMEKLKIPEPVYAPEKEEIRKTLKLITIGVIALALIGAGAFVFFKNKTSPEPEPIIPIKVEPKISVSLIDVEETKITSLINGKNIFQLLREEAKTEQDVLTFKRIGILKNEIDFISLAELLRGLEIPISPYVFSELKNNYNLLIFSQETGKRIGMIVETNNSENIGAQMRSWEPTMLNDFKNLYPVELPGQAASKDFLDDNYKNVIIRYKNLPYSTLTLNYTILGNFLIIGTSKELIYSAIDRILPK